MQAGLGRAVEGAGTAALAFFAGFHGGIVADFPKSTMKKFFTDFSIWIHEKRKIQQNQSIGAVF